MLIEVDCFATDDGAAQSLTPQHYPALVLNRDYQPLSYYPLTVWSWQEAIKNVFLDRVTVVEEYDRCVRSATMEMALPSVIALKTHVPRTREPAFTRFNVFLRDRFRCQYCGERQELTFDHLIPRSRGGLTTWENVVAACSPCNLKKGSRLPKECHMHPKQKPFRPTTHQLYANGKYFPPKDMPASWKNYVDYMYWNSELEP